MGHIVSITHKGDFSATTKFLNAVSGGRYITDLLNKYGKMGVEALSNNTPKDTGLTAASWSYQVNYPSKDLVEIAWYNSNMIYENNQVSVAVLLQYGHGTRNGGWVEGRDYINPAIQPIFDQIAEDAWKEVIK